MASPDWTKTVKPDLKLMNDFYNKSQEELNKDKMNLKKSELKMMLPPTKTDLSQEERHKLREQILQKFKQNVSNIQTGSARVSPRGLDGKFDKMLSTSIRGRNSGSNAFSGHRVI